MEESISHIEKMINNDFNDWSVNNPSILKNCLSGICSVIKSQAKLISEIGNKKSNYQLSGSISSKYKSESKSPERNFKETVNSSNMQLIKLTAQKVDALETAYRDLPKSDDLAQLKNQIEQKYEKEICVS
jgi:hypothetical protein